MGREVRKVPEDWEHPKNSKGNYIPLYDGYEKEEKEFIDLANKKGLQEAVDDMGLPDIKDYMPVRAEEEKTHFMMYETCSEGTPISAAFETPEDLARWLTDSNASSFGSMGASYDGWLRVCQGGYACSVVGVGNVITSGVDGL